MFIQSSLAGEHRYPHAFKVAAKSLQLKAALGSHFSFGFLVAVGH